MTFPLGKPILLMAIISLMTGPAILVRGEREKKDLTLWLFAHGHAQTYRSIIDQFQRESGITVNIELLNGRAMPVRLQSLFMSGNGRRVLPDLVEVEIGWVGRFFRPPTDEIGLLPLNEYLERDGWDRRIVQRRFAPWSKRDVIFGVPHDVHPVGIAYRKDLFDAAGVDLASATTWREFQAICLEFQAYWRQRGVTQRHAIELPMTSADYVIVMLLQRGINLIDDKDEIHFTDPRVAETIAMYAQFVAGPGRIGSDSAGGAGMWTNDLLAGNLSAFIMPDWRLFDLKTFGSSLVGEMRMMPLPKFEPDDAPTSTWGGTMIGITRNSDRHEDAWKLIEFLYLSETSLKAHQKTSNILPPVIEHWNDPAYHREDPFFGGQKVDEMYINLAHQIPRRYVTPATSIASMQLSVIVSRAVEHVNRHGSAGLEEQCRAWCAEAADDLRRRVEHGKIAE